MRRGIVLALGVLVLSGCRPRTPTPTASATPASSPATRVLQAVELTPYAGAPVRKDFDAIIDLNAKRNQDVQNLADPKD